MPNIINIHLLFAACEYSSVPAEMTNPKSKMTQCH